MMMENVHLVPSDDDDLYSGYNDYNSALSTKDLKEDVVIQEALRTSVGRRPPMTSKPTTAARLGTSSGYREGTAARLFTGSVDGVTRPMTAVRGAGYTSGRGSSGQAFDPLNQAASTPAPPLEAKKENTPEEKIKKMEQKITELIEESCIANSRGDMRTALDRAKEASTKERGLIRTQEQAGLSDLHNLELTFSVLFNLANQYSANEMYTEALNTYQVITKNRTFKNASRLKVNMGNIYFKLGEYDKAVKMYRMALDQVPTANKDLRLKIMHNIGILFVKMGQFAEACSSFEYIMQEKPDFNTGLDVLVCYYALGDRDKMKRGLQMLLEVPLNVDDDEKYNAAADDPTANLVLEAIKSDTLRQLERQMKQEAERIILTAAKLISPVIEDSYQAGYNWCLETIKTSGYAFLAADLDINKAVMFLRQKEIPQAVEALKVFEKKSDSKVGSIAATNLSFIYYLVNASKDIRMQGDLDQAERYAELGREVDSYNAAAFVNLGTCSLARGDAEKAKELFMFALENDAACVEALYNLGLVNKQLGLLDDALNCFLKLQSIVRHHPQVLYQLGTLYESVGDVDQGIEWFLQLLGIVPTDPGVLQKLGEIFDRDHEKQQAYHYHFESYRYYPSNFDVIDWLGSYFIELQVAEKAIAFFERATLLQPDEVKWYLLVASCHRRSGNYQQALLTYKNIHKKFPENIECLKFLVRLCSDLGLKEAVDYAVELKKAEKAKEVRSRIGSSRPGSIRSQRSGSGESSRGDSGYTPNLSTINSAGNPLMYNNGVNGDMVNGQNHDIIDTSYSDPLGPPPMTERPRTSAGMRPQGDDFFGDEELGDDLLPE